ncbi:MAG TPA: T9SS type A sorting domain-containing protein, partial [Puia sp.]|nr:T9SS type A sorting domain-containing protein [Puia sp.]
KASGAATICGSNATQVVLHAATTGDDVALWYDSQTATVPIAAGNNTSTSEITSNKTYYVALNDLQLKGGAPNKLQFASTSSTLGGAYFRFGGNFVMFTTGVPLTIESAKMYIGHSGKMTFTLATLASLDNSTGGYSYYPLYSTTLDVYATTAHPDTAQQVNVAPGDNTDTGATYLLNIPVPTPGSYIIIIDCANYASAFLNANIKTDPYPLTIPGIFSVTGNDFRDYGKADSVTYSHKFYYPFYNIGIRLPGCPGPRTAVTATTEPSPSISLSGKVLTSTASYGNQWYLGDSALAGHNGVTDTAKFPGLYYTMVTDTVTGCVLTSNKIQFTPTGDANTQIGLTVAPNPSSGTFQLVFYMATADNTSIIIDDMYGQKLYEEDHSGFSGFYNQTINVPNLASGLYILQIIHGGQRYKTTIMIRH